MTETSTPTADDCLEALRRVLGSKAFADAPRGRELLSFVATESVEGRGPLLNARKVARLALGRPADFDAAIDPSVRVSANRLRTRLDRYYRSEGASDPVRIVIPLGHYAADFVHHAAPAGWSPDPRLERGTGGPLVAVVALRSAPDRPDDEAMAIGLAESLVHLLSRFPLVRVVGPLPAGAGGADDPDVVEIGSRTGADWVLHGSLHSGAGVLRVTALLAETSSGEVCWAEMFERHLECDTGFAVEDDIAGHVASAVADFRGAVLRADRHRASETDNPAAYSAITRFLDYLDDLDPAQVPSVREGLETAAALEPDNPQVLAALGFLHAVEVLVRGPVAAATALERASELGAAALAIDPANLQAHGVMAVVALARDDTGDARRHAYEILDRVPYHPSLDYIAALVLAGCGDWDEAIGIIRRSTGLNPYYPRHRRLLLAIDDLRRGDIASALAEAVMPSFPGFLWGSVVRAVCLARLGMTADARAEVASLLRLQPDLFERPHEILSAPALRPEIVDLLVAELDHIAPLAEDLPAP